MRHKQDHEAHSLFYGDYLYCPACLCIVWTPHTVKATFKYSEIQRAYFAHIKKCFGLKRLIIQNGRA